MLKSFLSSSIIIYYRIISIIIEIVAKKIV